jgi:hypothetical protein
MSPRNGFALALRSIGIWKLVDGLFSLVAAYDIHAGYFTPATGSVEGELHVAYAQLAVGIVLVLGADFLAGLLVRRQAGESETPVTFES